MPETIALIDASAIARLKSDVGPESASLLVKSLKKEITKSCGDLANHISSNDLHMAETQAHALKSAARSFGAMQLGEACYKLEQAAHQARPQTALQAIFSEMEGCVEETLEALKKVRI